MKEQFIGKPFWSMLGILFGTFLVAIPVFHVSLAEIILIAGISIGVFLLSLKRLEWGVFIAFGELFANAHGHLISADVYGFPISLRMAIYIGVMAAWMVCVIQRKAVLPLRDARLTPFIMLAAAASVGFVIGFLQNNPIDAFKDGNAYFYAAYILPILSVRWNATSERALLQVLMAAATWVSVQTFGLLYVFTHFPEWMLGPVYTFIRDTRTGELTKMVGNIFRIFLQSQLSVLFAWILLAPFAWTSSITRTQRAGLFSALTAGTAVLLISLSRSFWVGMAGAGLVFLGLMLRYKRPTFKTAVRGVILQGLTIPAAATVLILLVLFPLPYRVGSAGDLASLFSSRTTDTGDVAISSRWELLGPLLDEIKNAPLLGAGFGETVTFKTDDPRARAISPDGTWTTYALEWGWLELWLKMGVLGPLAFLFLFVSSVRGLWPLLSGERLWLGIGLLASLVLLYATHVFSPYLNHPLGIGFLLFLVPFLQQKTPAVTEASASPVRAAATPQTSTAVLTSE